MLTKALQVGAYNVNIKLTVKEDGVVQNLSTATTKEFIFRKPSGTVITKTALFVTDGSDGKLVYTTLSGEIDEIGVWELQANLIFPALGYKGRTAVTTFEVLPDLT